MKTALLIVSLFLNLFSLPEEIRAQENNAQVDVASVYKKGLPVIRKIRSLLKAEGKLNTKTYRRLRSGLRKGNYQAVSTILNQIESVGGNSVDAAVRKLRKILRNNGVALFQNTPQAGGETLATLIPVAITWTGYANGNGATVGQIPPALNPPTLNPSSATASYAATPSTVCTVDSGTGALTIVGAGSCKITLTATPADPAANTAGTVNLAITIGPGAQTVTSNNPYGSGTLALSVEGFLALQTRPIGGSTTLKYQSTDASVCTVGATSGDVTGDAVGTCVVQAQWVASSNYNASPWTTIHTFTVGKGNQAAPSRNNIYGASPTVGTGQTLAVATTPSGGGGHGTLEYQSTDTSACTVSDTTGTVTAKTVASCRIRVRWRGDANYHPSPWHNILSITPTQTTRPVTIAWAGYAGGNVATVGQTVPALSAPTLNPSTSTASYSATPAAICRVNSQTGALTIVGAGNCEVSLTATPADATAHTPQTASITVTVARGSQTISFHLPYYYGSYRESALNVGKFLILRRAPTGGHTSLEYKTNNPGVCTVDESGHATGHATGSCAVQARWVENANYDASPWTTIHTFTVGKGSQAAPAGNNVYGNGPALAAGNTLSVATAPSGGGGHGSLEYQSTNTANCTVNGITGVVNGKAIGPCGARVRWRGNAHYHPSPWLNILSITLTVGTQRAPTATDPYGRVPSVAVDATLDIARAPSGGHGTLEYQSVDTGACTVDAAGTVTAVSSAGNCTIQARWTGNRSFTPTPWTEIATIAITETQQPGQGRYQLGEFGIYDSGGNLVIKTGALDTPKKLAYLFDNPIKLRGITGSEKTYIQNTYKWREDPSAPLTTLVMVDLRNYPRYGDEPRPKTPFSHPFVILVDNVIIDLIGTKVRTSPSRTRKEAIDKMFAWLMSTTPGIGRDRIYPHGGSVGGALRACLDQNYTRLSLSPINSDYSDNPAKLNKMRGNDTPSIDLVGDLKTYINSDNPYAGFYFVRAAQLLSGRYRKRQNNTRPAFVQLDDPKHQIKDASNRCYNSETGKIKPLYGHIEIAFDFQAFNAIIKDATGDADVIDIMAKLVTEEAGKTEEQRLSEIHNTISFNFNFRDPQRGYVKDPNICYHSQNGPRTNVPYTKRWLLGMLADRYFFHVAFARDWILTNYEMFIDRITREHHYALWRRRPLIDYARHNKSTEFSVLWSSGYCFPTDDFKAVQTARDNGEQLSLMGSIAVRNNIYRYIGEGLDRM